MLANLSATNNKLIFFHLFLYSNECQVGLWFYIPLTTWSVAFISPCCWHKLEALRVCLWIARCQKSLWMRGRESLLCLRHACMSGTTWLSQNSCLPRQHSWPSKVPYFGPHFWVCIAFWALWTHVSFLGIICACSSFGNLACSICWCFRWTAFFCGHRVCTAYFRHISLLYGWFWGTTGQGHTLYFRNI